MPQPRRNAVPAAPAPPQSNPSTTISTPLSQWDRLIAAALLIGAVLVPLYVSPAGDDHFRLPKELLMYAAVIVAAAIAGVALTLERIELTADFRGRVRMLALFAAAGLVWALISTITSANRALSVDALIWGVALVLLFFVGAYALRHVPLPYVAAALFVPAIANATLLLLQAFDVWNPWVFPEDLYFRAKKIAFLGNPDDAGVYLAAPALFAAALALTANRWRAAYGLIWFYLTTAMLATETLTAIGGYTVALIALVVVWKPRAGVLAIASVPVVIMVLMLFGPARERIIGLSRAIQRGNWGAAVSGRLVPFAAALQMCADRPLVGVGPGCYKFRYMEYYVRTRDEKPRLFRMSHTPPVIFAEAHSDHLQLLAEIGVPGYLSVAGAMLCLAWTSRRGRRDRERNRIATVLAAPLVVLLAVVALAQFPLLIAGPAYTYTLLGALCVAWSRDDDDAGESHTVDGVGDVIDDDEGDEDAHA